MLHRLAVTCVLTAILTSCVSTRAGDEAAVRTAMAGFMDALNALDADRMASHFADDMTAFFPVVKAERVDGKSAIVAIFNTYVEGTKKNVSRTNIVAEDLRVDVRGDVAVVTFNVHNPSATSRRTFVWRRDGGRWLIAHMHASNYALAK
jgi:uncharacterized protein (TIGR02246 family)